MIPGATCADPAARLRVHRRSSSREMEQVLHVADSLHLARLPDEVLDQFRPRHLSAQLDDPVLHGDVELALRNVRVAEDLAADLVRERGVVEVLRLFLEVLNLLRDAVRLCGDAAAGALRPVRTLPLLPPLFRSAFAFPATAATQTSKIAPSQGSRLRLPSSSNSTGSSPRLTATAVCSPRRKAQTPSGAGSVSYEPSRRSRFALRRATSARQNERNESGSSRCVAMGSTSAESGSQGSRHLPFQGKGVRAPSRPEMSRSCSAGTSACGMPSSSP